jgi:acetyltransferase EpsM
MSDRTRELLILGTGPHALEMFAIVERLNRNCKTWNVVGFASSVQEQPGAQLGGLPLLILSEAVARFPAAYMVPEFEWPNKADLPADRLATLIDPTVFVAPTAKIGRGCVIYPQCFVGSYSHIGDFLFCLAGSIINHNDIIEDQVTLTSSVTIAGDVHIEAACYFGQSSTVRQMLRVGKGSLIGMGAVVLHDVPPNSVMVGNPARRLRVRELKFPGVNVLRAVKRRARRELKAIRTRLRLVRVRMANLVQAPGSQPS